MTSRKGVAGAVTRVFRQRRAMTADAARVVTRKTWMKRHGHQQLLLRGLFATIVALGLGHAGPYGTYEAMPLLSRTAYWLVAILLPWSAWQLLYTYARKWAPNDVSWLPLTAGLMIPFAVIGSAGSVVTSTVAFNWPWDGFFRAWPTSLLSWLVFSLLIILPLQWIGNALARDFREVGGSQVADFLLHKLPAQLRTSQLLAMKSEDHYLRVYTSGGDDLILMSLSDALRSLEGYPGIQTHRSWWVSLETAREMQASTSWDTLTTKQGLTIPVSRRRKKEVKAAVMNENVRNHDTLSP